MKKINLNLKKIGVYDDFVFYFEEKDEGLSNELQEAGMRAPYNSKYTYKSVDESDTVLDIGANLGYFTVLCKNAKKIVSIEPLPNAIPILKKNIKVNKLSDKSKVVNAAVGKNKGHLYLETNKKLNLSKIVDKKNPQSSKIKSESLKDLIGKYNANFIRMDVEGYEYELLFENIPKKINKIAMEFHTDLLGKERKEKLLKYFEEEGFKVKYFISDIPTKLNKYNNFLIKTKLDRFFVTIKKDVPFKKLPKLIENRGNKVIMRIYKNILKRRTACHLILER